MVDERKRGARKKRERVFTFYFIIVDTFYVLLNWFSTCVSDNRKYEKWLSLYADWLQSINSIVTYSLSENRVCWLAPKYILLLLTYFRKTNLMTIVSTGTCAVVTTNNEYQQTSSHLLSFSGFFFHGICKQTGFAAILSKLGLLAATVKKNSRHNSWPYKEIGGSLHFTWKPDKNEFCHI